MRGKRVNIDLGVIEAADGLVRNYIEKPSLRYQVSMGGYVYDERALDFLPDGVCQFPDLVLRLLEAGEPVAAFDIDAEKYGIGPLARTDHELIPAMEPEEELAEVARRRAAAMSQRR
jgi:NDP-sugar pyrophosphorylase family protein